MGDWRISRDALNILGRFRRSSNTKRAEIRAIVEENFDSHFYLSRNIDVRRNGVEPVTHYLEKGWLEGRDPAPWFSTHWYLNTYPDVRAGGINPFVHFLMHGKAEGRETMPRGEFDHEWLAVMNRYPERPPNPEDSDYDPKRLRIHWLVPDFDLPGSGGHRNIFRMISWLEDFGHDCHIWITSPKSNSTPSEVRAAIARLHRPVRSTISLFNDDFFEAQGDCVLATHWHTVWPASHAQGFKQRFYFVQDYEPLFYSAGAEALAAQASYGRDLIGLCAGPWLAHKLQSEHGRKTASYDFAFDADFYHPPARRPLNSVPRIAVYARKHTARRGVELILAGLAELALRQVPFQADLFGSHAPLSRLPFAFEDHGILSEEELGELYRQADIGLCFSATNYSITCKEMMASGLPVVELDSECSRAVFPADVATLTSPEPKVIAASLERLLRDREGLLAQGEAALRWVQQFNWEDSARKIEAAMIESLAETGRWSAVSSRSAADSIQAGNKPPKPELSRIIFVGQPEYYRASWFDALEDDANACFELRSERPERQLQHLMDAVTRHRADSVIVFRPEWLARCNGLTEALQSHGVKVVGMSSEPIPVSGRVAHPDQEQRFRQLMEALPLPLDLLVHYDFNSASFLKTAGFRRLICHPLPVSSRLFFPDQQTPSFDACFLGRSTARREHFLARLKREMNIVHVAHGLVDEEARLLMNRSACVVNLHCEQYQNFETRAVQALRCGRPLISERLSGPWLVAGDDYILIDSQESLFAAVEGIKKGDDVRPASANLAPFDMESLLVEIRRGLRELQNT